MRLPSILRRTPFRLALLFLALFATAASALLGYIYIASAGEARTRAEADIRRELAALTAIHDQRGLNALNAALVERASAGGRYLYLLSDPEGRPQTGNISESPIDQPGEGESWETFRISQADARGRVERRQAMGVTLRLSGGHILFVGEDIGDTEAYLERLTSALWGAAALVFLLGLGGGILLSRQVERAMAGLNKVVAAVQSGDLKARARVRGAGDEFDELATGLNAMLDRLEGSMASIRHAGDAIAHDLRSPLTRMRAKLEVALIDVEAGRTDPSDALAMALDETQDMLKTFNTVLAIARLQAASEPPDPERFDLGELAADMADLYAPAAEDKGLDFASEIERGLMVDANRGFLSQALANVIDNAIKYTPEGGAVMMRARRRSNGDVEVSLTDTGPGVPAADRERVTQRFVRLEGSRKEPGSGLGLSLVSAVVEAHGGRLQLDEGPGTFEGSGPGLRVALILPPV